MQNVKAVFDADIKVVIKPQQKQREEKNACRGCLLLVNMNSQVSTINFQFEQCSNITLNYTRTQTQTRA